MIGRPSCIGNIWHFQRQFPIGSNLSFSRRSQSHVMCLYLVVLLAQRFSWHTARNTPAPVVVYLAVASIDFHKTSTPTRLGQSLLFLALQLLLFASKRHFHQQNDRLQLSKDLKTWSVYLVDENIVREPQRVVLKWPFFVYQTRHGTSVLFWTFLFDNISFWLF